jgi:UDP-GlcNAc:undecaprenyl-phosphate GlcNAc-1-phosphate transferase
MNFLFPFALAYTVTFLITPAVIALAKKYKLVDDPRVRYHPAHTHKGIIPRAGGLALYAGILVAIAVCIPISKSLIGILLGSSILVIVGLLDDRKDVNPYIRLTTNAIAATIVVLAGVGIPYITSPITGGVISLDTWRISFTFAGTHSIIIWADLFAFLWIMWTMNIVGWSAGVDGQMPGFVAICAFVLGLLSLRYTIADPKQIGVTALAFITSGAFAGFLPWNFFPQKIMPGYGGKTLAGFLLAILAILSYGKVGTALLVLGIPTMDAVYTLVRRIGKSRSPVLADSGHLHHRLLRLGWGKRKIALFYWLVSAILGAIALTITSQQKVYALLLVAVAVGGLLLWLAFFSRFYEPRDPDNG